MGEQMTRTEIIKGLREIHDMLYAFTEYRKATEACLELLENEADMTHSEQKNSAIKRFIDCYKEEHDTQYSAGTVCRNGNDFIVGYAQTGAEDTFSVGQPIYDDNGNLMGYLGITLYENLDYSADIRIPVEKWKICMPTKNCEEGKRIYTYWQNKEKESKDSTHG